MPKYVLETLKKLMYIPKVSPQYSLYKHVPIQYGNKQQYTQINEAPWLNPKNIKKIQSIIGSFLYYVRALDYTLLPAVNETSSTQAKPTTYTEEEY